MARADLGSELSLPLGGDFRAGGDLLVDLGGLRTLAELLRDAGLQGLLTHEHGGLQFLPQEKVMLGFLHLREKNTSKSLMSHVKPKDMCQINDSWLVCFNTINHNILLSLINLYLLKTLEKHML